MNEALTEIETAIASCMLPKLDVNYDEKEIHPEITRYKSNVSDKLKELIAIFKNMYVKNLSKADSEQIFSLLLILYEALKSGYIVQKNELANIILAYVEKTYTINLENIFNSNTLLDHQKVFDKCIEIIHEKLTSEDWKRYPALVDAYCGIVSKVQADNIVLDPVKVLPASLLLMWDHNKDFILKGLSCCQTVLQYVTDEHFGESNYQEAIYQILKKIILDKETRIIVPAFECTLQLINVYPVASRDAKVGEIMCIVLDEAIMESNLERRSTMLQFLKTLIGMYGTDSIRWKKKISSVILENLTLCTMDNIPVKLLENTLEVLQQWHKYCWCVWNYEEDKSILSCLLKVHCIANQKNELQHLKSKIFGSIIVAISLSSKQEKNRIRKRLSDNMYFIEKANLKDLFNLSVWSSPDKL